MARTGGRSYAYTLSGHEYSANDDFEKAMACYRSAIRIDARHYNAWYGLGNIYFRQEKYDFSEHHLRKALGINPCSSPLYCYLGMALHANQKTPQALEMLTNAINIDPKNPLARFQKAQVLLSTDQYELALTELKQLVEMAPKEGSIYFVLGKARCTCLQRPRPRPAKRACSVFDVSVSVLVATLSHAPLARRRTRSLVTRPRRWCISRVLST